MAGIDSYTKLMLHMNSDFSDSSGLGHVPTIGNGASIDTVIKKFGAGSGKFVGASVQYVSYPDSADWAFGANNFTIDTWVRFNSFTNVDPLIAHQGVDNNNYWVFQVRGASFGLRFYNFVGGVAQHDFNQGSATGWNTGQQYHVALVRNGNVWNLYRDGISVANMTNSTAMTDFASPLYLATFFDLNPFNLLDGNLDEFRISKGIARWTSNFTPPTSEYTGGGGGRVVGALAGHGGLAGIGGIAGYKGGIAG